MKLLDETKQDGDFAGESMSSGPQDPQVLPLQQEDPLSNRSSGRKWFRQWVPYDTVLNPGKCFLLKWVNDDLLKSLKDKYPEVEREAEEEYEIIYLCNFEGCGKAFTEQGALRKHTHVHGEKQFICHYEGCGKRFVDSSKLKRHFLIHTGEKHFVCPVDGCGKAFSLDFNLRSHMRTHTQENYHVCPFEECGKRYAHEYKLRAHLRTCHDKTLPPEMKLTPPPPLPNIEREIMIPKMVAPVSTPVNLERPFACHYEGCDKRYIHEYKLNLHLRKEHAHEENTEEVPRAARLGDNEDDMDEGSEREIAHTGKVGVLRGSGRGKLRIISKSGASKTSKRKRASAAPVDLNLKIQGVSRPGRRKEAAKRELQADSEETEEEYQEDTDDEDLRRMMQMRMMACEDDEETEDDME